MQLKSISCVFFQCCFFSSGVRSHKLACLGTEKFRWPTTLSRNPSTPLGSLYTQQTGIQLSTTAWWGKCPHKVRHKQTDCNTDKSDMSSLQNFFFYVYFDCSHISFVAWIDIFIYWFLSQVCFESTGWYLVQASIFVNTRECEVDQS